MIDSEQDIIIQKILTLDIGGTTIKATVLDHAGNLLQEYKKVPTPKDATPQTVLEVIQYLVAGFQDYDRISVGFPGYVKNGVIYTAPNLGTAAWKNVNLNQLISEAFHKPVRVVNDADMQGLGVVSRKGFEMVITLGTGFGTALLFDGHLLPHIELAHHCHYQK